MKHNTPTPNWPPGASPDWNCFQRWYFSWAEAQYQHLPANLVDQVRAVDRYIFSRRGAGAWMGGLLGTLGSALGMWAGGLPWWWSLFLSGLVMLLVFSVLMAAFVMPHEFSSWRKTALVVLKLMGLAVVAAAAVALLQDLLRTQPLLLQWWPRLNEGPAALGPSVWAALHLTLPLLGGAALVSTVLVWSVAKVRREQLQQALLTTQLQQERDAAAREALEFRLKLLQAQVQPHFIFNTLSALQHWVDVGDTRASPLLRALTAFLRRSAELLGRPTVTLGEELDLVRSYLHIMGARLGERLQSQVDVPEDCLGQDLPPGLVLSLVENALEHGIAPTLHGGTVTVSARRGADSLALQVSDNGQGLPPEWREGMGLSNSRQRLQHLYGDRARLSLKPLPQGCAACLDVQKSHQ